MSTAAKAEQKVPALKTWDECDEALRNLGKLEVEIDVATARCNGKITEAQADLKRETLTQREQRAMLEKQIEDFWEAHKREVEGKSKKMTFGTIGYGPISRAVGFLKGWTEEKVLAALKGKEQLKEWLRFGDPALNRQRIKSASDEELKKLERYGITIEESESFFIKPFTRA